jgi:hypothetical protein
MTWHNQAPENLQRLVDLINAKLAKLQADLGEQPDWRSYDARNAYDKRERLRMQELLKELQREEGASFDLTTGGLHALRLAGIRSSSTINWHGCLGNWKAAAAKRIAKEVA